jgi:hypothetical protein
MSSSQLESVRKDVVVREASRFFDLLDTDTMIQYFNPEHVSKLLKTAKVFQVIIVDGQRQIPRKLKLRMRKLMDENPNVEFRCASPRDIGVAGFTGEWLIADAHVFVEDTTGGKLKSRHSNGTTAAMYRFAFQAIWNQSRELFDS